MGTIFGIFQRQGRAADRSRLEAMAAALEARVADRQWLWAHATCALGARLLLRAPGADSEVAPPDHALDHVIACDARIDNRAALIAQFALEDAPQSDSALILALYRSAGRDFVSHLEGAFAFAIFDAKAQTLFCARDHFGEKPFAYAVSGETFAFASEAHAVIAAGLTPAGLDEQRLADILQHHPSDNAATIYAGIARLPPAHILIVSRQEFSIAPYWQPAVPAQPAGGSDDEIAARFRKLLTEAVACRVSSTTPVGCFLSGGLDSSAVTMLAREALAAERPGEALFTYSAIFPDIPESDERRWIEEVEQSAGPELSPLRTHWLRADKIGPVDYAAELVDSLDEPVLTPNLFKTWALGAAARDDGVGVMLTGHDGDTVVSHGFAWLTELALAEDWDTLERELARICELLENYDWVRPAFLRDYVLPVLPYLRNRAAVFRLARTAKALRTRFGISHRDIARALLPRAAVRLKRLLRPGAPAAGMAEIAASFRASPPFRRRQAARRRDFPIDTGTAHLLGLQSPLIAETFEFFDRIGARLGVEMRHPFFDRRLVEFCLSLPRDQKVRDGWTRFVMRSALGGILPEAIRWRRDKSNLGHNFAVSLLKDARALQNIFQRPPETFASYWDTQALGRLLARYVSSPTATDALTLHLAFTHALWLQKRGEHRAADL